MRDLFQKWNVPNDDTNRNANHNSADESEGYTLRRHCNVLVYRDVSETPGRQLVHARNQRGRRWKKKDEGIPKRDNTSHTNAMVKIVTSQITDPPCRSLPLRRPLPP